MVRSDMDRQPVDEAYTACLRQVGRVLNQPSKDLANRRLASVDAGASGPGLEDQTLAVLLKIDLLQSGNLAVMLLAWIYCVVVPVRGSVVVLVGLGGVEALPSGCCSTEILIRC